MGKNWFFDVKIFSDISLNTACYLGGSIQIFKDFLSMTRSFSVVRVFSS